MRLVGSPSVHNVATLEDLKRFTANYLTLLTPILNGGVEFGSNIRSQGPIEFNIEFAGQVTTLEHTLGYVPAGYLLCYQTTDAVIYAADPSVYVWTNTKVFVTASKAVRARAILF